MNKLAVALVSSLFLASGAYAASHTGAPMTGATPKQESKVEEKTETKAQERAENKAERKSHRRTHRKARKAEPKI